MNARIDEARLDRWARATCLTAVALYLLHAACAVATHRTLYGDAAWFLLRMISEGDVTSFHTDFFREFYYSRFVSYAATQLPTLIALHLGMEDARHLSWILGATYLAHKPLSLLLCYHMLPEGRKSYIVFPLLGLFAGSINSEIYIVTETHLATSVLWPLVIAVTQVRTPGRMGFALIAIGLLLSAFVYESMAFFGPLLLLACVIRAMHARQLQRRGWAIAAACTLLPIAINWAAILFPRDPTNKSAFSNGVLKLVADTVAGTASAHVLGVASIIAVMVIAALMARGARLDRGRKPPLWAFAAAFVLAALPAAHFLVYARSVDFTYAITDRGFGGLVMQLAVIGLYALAIVLPSRLFRTAIPGALVVMSGLAIGQVAWQLLATHAWHGAVRRMESFAAANDGLESCTPVALRASSGAAPPPSSILCHWWVLPLSVVLAPDAKVQTLLVSDESFLPFDPRAPDALPNAPKGHIDYRPYLRALERDRQASLPTTVDFTASGTGSRYFRAGFSTPEAWATWTDGKMARLELCFGTRDQASPQLGFKLAPQVTAIRPRLAVAVDVGGSKVADWEFRLGERIVEREVAIPRHRLDRNGCAMVGFTFDDDRRASEIGVTGDPRRLGLAFLSVRTR